MGGSAKARICPLQPMNESTSKPACTSAISRWVCAAALVLGLLAAPLAQPQEKKIALTFNDLPFRGPLGFWRPREISNMILRALEKHGIRAAGFVVQEKVDDEPMLEIILDDWASRGHLLGNQTYSRVDFNVLSVDDFVQHVEDGQKGIRRYGRRYSFNYRYLRFPQLHQGNTKGKRKEIGKTLRRAGYQIAPVTVKTSDHQFIRAYLEHQSQEEAAAKIKQLFLAHVSESLDYAESQSLKVFGRNIPHIMLLRCDIAAAAFLDDLIQLLQQRGYSFVSFPEALKDPAYKTEEDYAGPLGLSFIDRVAAVRGLPFEEHQGELRRGDVESWLQK